MTRLLASALILIASSSALGNDFRVTNDPYSAVDWDTTLRCQAQGHEHAFDASRITALSNAGYCAATFMHYSGAYTANDPATWASLGSPNPDPGVPIGWGDFRRWPADSFGAPALPLNSLRFYLPGAEDIGLYASGVQGEHFYALGLTTYMEGAGCSGCGNSGSAVRNNNPLGLPSGQLFGTNQELIDKATALGAMVIINHTAGAPTSRDSLSPFPRAVEIWNGYHAFYDEETNATNECSLTPTNWIAEFQALWDHVLEVKSARIWGVSVNDWTGPWLATGNPPSDCFPLITTANRDRGKLSVLLTSYDLSAYLDAFNRGAFFAIVENNATKSGFPTVTDISITSSAITLATAAGTESISWIANGVVRGNSFSIPLNGLPAGTKYLRAVLDDGAGRQLYTQPFELTEFSDGGGSISGGSLSGGGTAP